ncbi:MAG: type I-E CRISPR-associated protein Cas7/Cse4/CasC [Myxococcales bacterium]|nr:type I-E CRISPR-associated protein Cas7/Cse4/CasC [Myxococcales bacterium]
MKIELHILQNFAPANLNRDDTGAPKDCELGGHRRARISSQCQKRAVRQAFEISGLVPEEERGARTKRIVHKIAEVLQAAPFNLPAQQAGDLAYGGIEGVGLGFNKKGEGDDLWKTEYLLFVPARVVDEIAGILFENRELLSPTEATTPEADDAKARKSKKDLKKDAKAAYPDAVRRPIEALLAAARSTTDIALFGRMIADKANWNVNAACQVAHAISTHKVQMEFDFYTALDDYKPDDTAGSDMMGTIQFNSSCFYRYAVLDVAKLQENLDVTGDEGKALLTRAIDAFARAFMTAIPTGKQNSMAAHNFPSYALAVVRSQGQPVSLTNAFLKPARHGRDEKTGDELDLVDVSIGKLEAYFGRLREVIGAAPAITWADRDLPAQGGIERCPTLAGFYHHLTGAIGAGE